jgi:hypothetical protein
LVDAIVDWSHEAGAEEIRLWVVEINDSALDLYLRKGFEETGEVQRLPSNPSLTETHMVLRLNDTQRPDQGRTSLPPHEGRPPVEADRPLEALAACSLARSFGTVRR